MDTLFSWSFTDSSTSSLLLNPCNDPLKKVLLLPRYRVWESAELVRVTPLELEPTEVWLQGWMKSERCDYGRGLGHHGLAFLCSKHSPVSGDRFHLFLTYKHLFSTFTLGRCFLIQLKVLLNFRSIQILWSSKKIPLSISLSSFAKQGPVSEQFTWNRMMRELPLDLKGTNMENLQQWDRQSTMTVFSCFLFTWNGCWHNWCGD